MPGYETPPGTRIAYDLDGTVGFVVNGTTHLSTDMHPNALTYLNSEYNSGVYMGGWSYSSTEDFPWQRMSLIFPQPLKIDALWAIESGTSASSGSSVGVRRGNVYFSSDTTNGMDGTWTKVQNAVSVPVVYAQDIGNVQVDAISGTPHTGNSDGQGFVNMPRAWKAATIDDQMGWVLTSGTPARHVRGVQFRAEGQITSFAAPMVFRMHLYGSYDTDASNQRLEFWQDDMDLRIDGSSLWWSDIPRGSSADKTFRIKNMHSSLTATGIVIDALPGVNNTTPTVDGFYLFSLNGTTWSDTLTLPNLPAGNISPDVFVRLTVPSTAGMGRWSPRIKATVGGWS